MTARILVRFIDKLLRMSFCGTVVTYFILIVCVGILGISRNYAADMICLLFAAFFLTCSVLTIGVLFVDIGFRIFGKIIDWDSLVKKPMEDN